MRRLFSVLLGSALVAAPLVSASAVAAATPAVAPMQDWLADELADSPPDLLPVLVHAAGPAQLQEAKDAIAAVGMRELLVWDAIGVAVGYGTPAQVEAVRREPGVTYVEGNQPYEYSLETSHQATRADLAIDPDLFTDPGGNRVDGAGGTIAIIDSGVDGLHPMFTDPDTGDSKVVRNLEQTCLLIEPTGDQALDNQLCLRDEPSNNTDSNSAGGHGTHVSGIAAGYEVTDASGRNLRGAAPGAKLMMVSAGGGIAVIGAVNGMNWILANHEDPCAGNVYAGITYPESGPECPPIVATNHSYGAINGGDFNPNAADVKFQRLLVAEGIVVNWAAGNSGGDGSADNNNPPSKDPTPGVMSVANYDDANAGSRNNALAGSSSRGLKGTVATYPDISAPGTNITSACLPTLPICGTGFDTADPFYNTITGTSMASPHVAGYVATLRQADPTLTPAQIEDLIEDTAHKFTAGGAYEPDLAARNDDDTTSFDKGHGLIDMAAALASLSGTTVPDPPAVCPASPLLTDTAGDADAFLGVSAGARNEPSLDIIEMDLTANEVNDVTFALKVADIPTTNSGYGQVFDINFTLGGGSYYVQPSRDGANVEDYVLGDFGGSNGRRRTLATLTGSFDPESDVVSITLANDALATAAAITNGPTIESGTVIGGINVVARYDLIFLVPDADRASAICPFVVGESIQDPTLPTLRIGDIEVGEGDSGTTDAVFTITRDGPTDGVVSVEVATTDGTATSVGDEPDFDATPSPTTVSIADGQRTGTVTIAVNGDTVVEDDETFTVTLANPTGADVSDPEAIGTIADDDDATPPTLSISDVSIAEGDDGETSPATFVVRLSEQSSASVTVDVSTVNGSADWPADYERLDAVELTFVPGEVRKEVDVTINGDDLPEPDEDFTANLSNPSASATIADGRGDAVIIDDDEPSITVDDVTVTENAGDATFTISLVPASSQTVTVDYLTAAGTATAQDDYVVTSGRAVFRPGDTTFEVDVPIVDDEIEEDAETFELRLSTATNASISDGTGVATISANDEFDDDPSDEDSDDDDPSDEPAEEESDGDDADESDDDEADEDEDADTTQPSSAPRQQRAVRIEGPDRFATAAAISRAGHPTDRSVDTVVLALGTDANRPDVLVGAPLAAALDAPLLTVTPDAIPQATMTELRRVLRTGASIVVLGGPDAVGTDVDAELESLGYDVRRIAGQDRFETAVKVAQELGDPDELFITTGFRFPDSLAAGAVAANRGGAILLTDDGVPTGRTVAYLSVRTDATAYAIGGPAARAFPDLEAIAGDTRESTAVAVAERFLPDATTIVVSRSDLPFDALAAGSYAGKVLAAPIVLTASTMSPAVEGHLCRHADVIDTALVLGGTAALSGSLDAVLADRIQGIGC